MPRTIEHAICRRLCIRVPRQVYRITENSIHVWHTYASLSITQSNRILLGRYPLIKLMSKHCGVSSVLHYCKAICFLGIIRLHVWMKLPVTVRPIYCVYSDCVVKQFAIPDIYSHRKDAKMRNGKVKNISKCMYAKYISIPLRTQFQGLV